MCFIFTRETSSCNECTPLVHCPFCIEPIYGYCREHEMENKHRILLREQTDIEELTEVVAIGDRIESFLTNVSNMVRGVLTIFL
jgi:hypothetical protein